jgi:hypothetical protein
MDRVGVSPDAKTIMAGRASGDTDVCDGLEDEIRTSRDRPQRLSCLRHPREQVGWHRAWCARWICRHLDGNQNRSENQWILRSISQAIVAGVAGIGTINQPDAANQASDALRFSTNIHGSYFDILNARANAAVVRWLGQKERRMRNCIAVPVPARMFTNENWMIDLTGYQ